MIKSLTNLQYSPTGIADFCLFAILNNSSYAPGGAFGELLTYFMENEKLLVLIFSYDKVIQCMSLSKSKIVNS